METEFGFYHPSRGYWQTTSEPSNSTRNTYPDGTVEVPLKPGADYEWRDNRWVHVPVDVTHLLALERKTMVCSRFQAKAALLAAGLLAQVEQIIEQADPLTKLTWAEAVEFHRSGPFIATIITATGITDEQMDEIFRSAVQIET
ncbi:MAG: hypothetical protein WCY93_07285 [Anaerolineaceae bacterium]